MAAGLGSRFGGLKQLAEVGPNGQALIDYALFDAAAAGCDQVVFIIRRDFAEAFRATIGARPEKVLRVAYAYQDFDALPIDITVPAERVKPWGTAHAVWAAREVIDGPFLVINADDFYGRPALQAVVSALQDKPEQWCMAGYLLSETLSPNGTVSRGVCRVQEHLLVTIDEHSKLGRGEDGAIHGLNFQGESVTVPDDQPVSLNCWGLSPAVLPVLENAIRTFLTSGPDVGVAPVTGEVYLPMVVADEVQAGRATVEVLPVSSPWYGVTYQEDLPSTRAALAQMHAEGIY
jgi:GTP:adenosylcobinamide-phosphate guanylyltransferase